MKYNRIKEVLKEKNMSQTELANRLNKSFNMVNGYVQNRRQPSIKTLYKIAKELNVEASYLLNSIKNLK